MYGSKQGWSLSTYPIHAVQKTTIALKNARILRVNVFSKKVLIKDTIFYGTAILRGHPSHAKVYLFAGQREYLHFSVILRPCVLIRPRESNPRLPALLSNALPTELTLPLNSGLYIRCKETDSVTT